MKKTLGWLFVAAMFLPVVAGCGSGEYEKRLDAGVEQVKKGSAFGDMQPPATLPMDGMTVQVRMPKQFDTPPLAAGSDGRRLNPPASKPRGMAATYEAFVTDAEGGKIAYYCYFGADRVREREMERFDDILQQRFEHAFPEARFRFDNVDALTSTGAAVEWKRMHADVNQPYYYVDASGAEDFRASDGFYEVWYRFEGDILLSIAWRMPTNCVASAEFDKWAPRIAGTMTLTAGDDGG